MSARELNCEEVIQQLFAFLDQRLDESHTADINRHLERCRECFSRAEFERALRSRITEATTVKAPERLQLRIKSILEEF